MKPFHHWGLPVSGKFRHVFTVTDGVAASLCGKHRSREIDLRVISGPDLVRADGGDCKLCVRRHNAAMKSQHKDH